MTGAEVVERARSAIGHHTIYALGKGGYNPASPFPWSSLGECDCSGFVAWCLMMSRHLDHPWYLAENGGWLETTAIVRDAMSPFGFFQKVDWLQARPGDLLVYGDHDGKQGHVGVVSALDAEGPAAAIHCSSGNYRTRGDAIQETIAALWKMRPSIVARYALID